MIKYLLRLLGSFWPNYNSSNIIVADKASSNELDPIYNYGSLSFILDEQDNVDIYCLLPDLSNLSDEDILDVAEKYAKLLLSVNKGLFKSEIYKILKNRKNKSTNPLEQLLIENISIFYRLLEEEFKNIKANQDPIIRPTQVFKIS